MSNSEKITNGQVVEVAMEECQNRNGTRLKKTS